jgi:hypothetical protein
MDVAQPSSGVPSSDGFLPKAAENWNGRTRGVELDHAGRCQFRQNVLIEPDTGRERPTLGTGLLFDRQFTSDVFDPSWAACICERPKHLAMRRRSQ